MTSTTRSRTQTARSSISIRRSTRYVLVPVAKAYRTVLPAPMRMTVHDFLQNLNAPVIFANDVLQADPNSPAATLARAALQYDGRARRPVRCRDADGAALSHQRFRHHAGDLGRRRGPLYHRAAARPVEPARSRRQGRATALPIPATIVAGNAHMLWATSRAAGRRRASTGASRNIETLADIESTSLDYYATIRSLYRQRRQVEIRHERLVLPNAAPQRSDTKPEPAMSYTVSPPSQPAGASCKMIGRFRCGHRSLCGPSPDPRRRARRRRRTRVPLSARSGSRRSRCWGRAYRRRQRLNRFRELFHNDFDVPGIGQFVLGRYWRTATPQEQQEFLQLFQEYIVRAYSARLAEYGGEPFRVTGTRPSGDETIVSSEIVRGNGAPVGVDWYLIERRRALQNHRCLCRRHQHEGDAARRIRLGDPAQWRSGRCADRTVAPEALERLIRLSSRAGGAVGSTRR